MKTEKQLQALEEAIQKNHRLGFDINQGSVSKDMSVRVAYDKERENRKRERRRKRRLVVERMLFAKDPAYIAQQVRNEKKVVKEQKYMEEKRNAIEAAKGSFQRLREENNKLFVGGYTMPAIQWHKVQAEFIDKQEANEIAKIEKQYDNSEESWKTFEEEQIRKALAELKTRQLGSGTTGGGYNHPGVFAPSVQLGVHYGY